MRLRLRSTYPPEDRALWHPRAYYALFFGGMAWVMPFLVLRYQEIGLSGEQIGLLAGLGPVVTLVASPFWGGLADATRRHKQIMMVNIAVAIVSMLLIGQMHSFLTLIPVVLSYSFFNFANRASGRSHGGGSAGGPQGRLWPPAPMGIDRLGHHGASGRLGGGPNGADHLLLRLCLFHGPGHDRGGPHDGVAAASGRAFLEGNSGAADQPAAALFPTGHDAPGHGAFGEL